jgi:small subunit ribosomal protein S2
LKHLHQNLAGVENMNTPPDAMFVVDCHTEQIAVREARRMGVPVVAVVDTNSDPDQIDWVIPGNDDALRAIRLFTSKVSDAVLEGRSAFEQTQLAGQKAEAGAEGGENVEYVDTSAYESYEKQEGDFVETPEGADVLAVAEQPVPAETETEG